MKRIAVFLRKEYCEREKRQETENYIRMGDREEYVIKIRISYYLNK
mgnify:CR=1